MVEIALLAIAVLVLTLTLGVPLPYCFGSALMVMYFVGDVTMRGMMLWGFQQLSNPVLLAIPLFVLAGTIMSESGIAGSLLRFVNAFIGHIRGGLGVVAAVSCAVIGAISGSGLTGIAATDQVDGIFDVIHSKTSPCHQGSKPEFFLCIQSALVSPRFIAIKIITQQRITKGLIMCLLIIGTNGQQMVFAMTPGQVNIHRNDHLIDTIV